MQIVEKRGYFILIFSYRPTIINAIKKELPSREWDWQNKIWKVPITGASRRQVQAFAQKHGFKMQDNKPQVDMFDRPIPPMPELELSDEQLKQDLKLTPYDYQKQGIAYAMQRKRVIIGDQPGLGKAQPLSANIATPNGFVKMGKICVGENIVGSNGKTYQVNGVFPQGENRQVVVDPKHSFGRPVIYGTNITTETLFFLHSSGELPEDLANDYELSMDQVASAIEFESRNAA